VTKAENPHITQHQIERYGIQGKDGKGGKEIDIIDAENTREGSQDDKNHHP
jgi:hypothetical protein